MKRVLFIVVSLIFLAGCDWFQKPTSQNPSTPRGPQVKEEASAMAVKYLELGKVDLERGDVQGAIKKFDEAIRRNPGDVRSYIVLGDTYLHIYKYDKAIDTLSAGLVIDPNNGPGNYMLAVAYNLRGDKELAIQHAQKTVQIFQKAKDLENFRKALTLLHSLTKSNGTNGNKI